MKDDEAVLREVKRISIDLGSMNPRFQFVEPNLFERQTCIVRWVEHGFLTCPSLVQKTQPYPKNRQL